MTDRAELTGEQFEEWVQIEHSEPQTLFQMAQHFYALGLAAALAQLARAHRQERGACAKECEELAAPSCIDVEREAFLYAAKAIRAGSDESV